MRDTAGKAVIDARITRLRAPGSVGVCESVGDGVYELKIGKGPGYRVYFGRHGMAMFLLLCGGDKSTQSKDIAQAKALWAEYKSRTKKEVGRNVKSDKVRLRK